MSSHLRIISSFLLLVSISINIHAQKIVLKPNSTISIIGNTFAERLQHFGHLETLLQTYFPTHNLKIRNLGWSADELNLQPRPLNFGSMDEHLENQNTDVIFACFGMNESYQGTEGLERFSNQLNEFVTHLKNQKYNGKSSPQIVLVSPIAHEQLGRLKLDPTQHNSNLRQYSSKMQKVAESQGVVFVNLFKNTHDLFQQSTEEFTINGIHLNERGYQKTSEWMMSGLGFQIEQFDWGNAEPLRQKIIEKNKQFFYRWRPVNGEYIYGRRKEPFGVKSFPSEWPKLDKIIANLEQEIWTMEKQSIVNP